MNTRNPQASAAPSPELISQLQTALAHQKKGEMDEAGKIFKKVLKSDGDNTDVQQIAAIYYDQIEEYDQSLKLLEKVIRKKPNDFAVNRLLGKALFHTGEYELAKMRLQKTLALNIEDAEANSLFAQCLFKMGNGKAAVGFFEDSLKRKDSIIVRNKLAEALLFCHRDAEATKLLDDAIEASKFNYETLLISAISHNLGTMQAYKRLVSAISLDPVRDEAKTLFTVPLTMEGIPEAINPVVKDVVTLCLQSRNVNHDHLFTLWQRQFFQAPGNEKAMELLEAKNYEDFTALYQNETYRETLLVPFFILGAQKIMSYGIRSENFYAHLRRYYLEIITSQSEELDSKDRNLLAALTEQSFSNEFVFNETQEETALIEEMRANLEKAVTFDDRLLIYACYRPLIQLNNRVDIHQRKGEAPTWLHGTIQTHIGQILHENKVKKSIPTLGKIEDAVSRKVKEQYEENPYPRWRSANFVILPSINSVDDKIKTQSSILIAGCGTGQHVFHSHATRPHAKITAVDLSSSSLAYAMIKTRDYGINKVEFIQADILQLEQLNKKYDVIESMGVLHHMKDPEAGLKVLLKLLNDGGEIALGLYSEIARKDVVKARQMITEKGFEPTIEGIRACRAYIKANSENFDFLTGSRDFYSTSAVRDLIFHVQERRYTLAQIQELLDKHDLAFKTFKLSNTRMAQYKSAFPDDKDANNLENWHEFEFKNPNTFSNMYQFIAVRR